MTEFTFIRHCQSAMNITPDIICGQNNEIEPTDQGRVQADTLGKYLAHINYSPDHIYSSAAVRARETGRIALQAAAISQHMEIDNRLLELSYGVFENQPLIAITDPKAFAKYRLGDLDGKVPDGESIIDVQNRMMDFLMEKHTEHTDGKILVFSHALAISSLIGKIRNSTRDEVIDLPLPNTSLTQITIDSNGPKVDFAGRIPAIAN